MEYESETTNTCGLCGNYNKKLLILNHSEKFYTCILYQLVICDNCMYNLENFKTYLKDFYLNQEKLQNAHANTMQDQDENPEEGEKHTDKYNCRCVKCQEKFGSLPLLVDVIEQNVDKTEPMPSTSQDLSPKTSRKLMKCTHCDKIFTHKGDYNKHLRKHTGEQPFSCSICDRKFAHTSNLARHMRLHSGQKPFICENCQKNFSRKDKLEQHKKSKSCSKTS